MTSPTDVPVGSAPQSAPESAPESARDITAKPAARVSFRQPVTVDGYVDAGWWPRSRDLAAELPALLEVLWTGARDVTRISYRLDFWDAAPRKLVVDGRLVHLGGYRYQDPLLLAASSSHNADRIEFLIIPPEADEQFAARALKLASTLDEVHTPADLLELAKR